MGVPGPLDQTASGRAASRPPEASVTRGRGGGIPDRPFRLAVAAPRRKHAGDVPADEAGRGPVVNILFSMVLRVLARMPERRVEMLGAVSLPGALSHPRFLRGSLPTWTQLGYIQRDWLDE